MVGHTLFRCSWDDLEMNDVFEPPPIEAERKGSLIGGKMIDQCRSIGGFMFDLGTTVHRTNRRSRREESCWFPWCYSCLAFNQHSIFIKVKIRSLSWGFAREPLKIMITLMWLFLHTHTTSFLHFALAHKRRKGSVCHFTLSACIMILWSDDIKASSLVLSPHITTFSSIIVTGYQFVVFQDDIQNHQLHRSHYH